MSLLTGLIGTIASPIVSLISDKNESNDIEDQARAKEASDVIKDKGEEIEAELDRKHSEELNSRREKAAKEVKDSFDISKDIDSELQSNVTNSDQTRLLSEINDKLTALDNYVKRTSVKTNSSDDFDREYEDYIETSSNNEKPKRPSIFKRYYLDDGTVAHGINRKRLRQDDLNNYRSEKRYSKVKDLYKKKEELENKRWFATLGLLGNINESQIYRTEKAIIKQKYEGEARNAEIKKLKEARKERRQAKLKKVGLMAALGLTPLLLSKNLRSLLSEFSDKNPIGKFFSGVFNAIKAPFESAWKWFTENTAIGQKIAGWRDSIYKRIGFDTKLSLWKNLTNKIDSLVSTTLAPKAADKLFEKGYITEEQSAKIRANNDLFSLIGSIISSVVSDTLFNWLGLDKLDKDLLGVNNITTLGGLLSALLTIFRSRLEGFDSIKEWVAEGGVPSGKLGEAFTALMKSLWDKVLEPVVVPLFQPIWSAILDLARKLDILDLIEKGKEYASKYTSSQLKDISMGKGVDGLPKPTLTDRYWANEVLNNPNRYIPVDENANTPVDISKVGDSIEATDEMRSAILKYVNTAGYNYNPNYIGEVRSKLFGTEYNPIPRSEFDRFISSIKDPIMLAIAGLHIVDDYSKFSNVKSLYENAFDGKDLGSDKANAAMDSILTLLRLSNRNRSNIVNKGILGKGGELSTLKSFDGKSEADLINNLRSYVNDLRNISKIGHKYISYTSIPSSLKYMPFESNSIKPKLPEITLPTEIPEIQVNNEDSNLLKSMNKTIFDFGASIDAINSKLDSGSATKVEYVQGQNTIITVPFSQKVAMFASNSADTNLNQ